MRRMRRVLRVVILVGCVAAVTAAAQSFPLGLLPTADDGEPLDVYVWTMDSVFEIGEAMEVHLAVSRAAFVYLFDLQPDGVVRMLYPNAYSPSNAVQSSITLPDGAYQLLVQPPAGIEELLAFAITQPLPLVPGTTTDPFPIFASSADQAIDQLVSMISAMSTTTSWAVGWTGLQITGSSSTAPDAVETMEVPEMPALPPFTATPGDVWHVAVGGGWLPWIPASGWYWYYGLDARWHLCWVWS